MKKILAVLCAAMFAGQAWAETITSGDIVYEVTGDKVEVTGYTGSATTVSIPLYFVVSGKYYTPKSIGDYAFKNNTSITKVSISPNVKIIGKGAFYGCSKLAQVEFYDAGSQVSALETIGDYAFSKCSNLSSITIPNSVTSIGYYAFQNCSSLTSITIPSSVTSIGSDAFYGCSGLTSVTIPNSVTSIGEQAFRDCDNLTSITIPSSVTWIGVAPFIYCDKLSTIKVESGNTKYSSENGVLFNKNKTTLVCYPKGKTGSSYNIPNYVTSIGEYAFASCSDLTSVTISNSVTNIGSSAFEGCSGLTSVTIPNSVTSIGGSAFDGCSGLTSVTIPNSVTSIGSWAFEGCSGLTSITIPNSVTSIGGYAFYGCSGLTSVTIPNSVTSIGYVAFFGCSGLKSVTIPNSVTGIAIGAFSGCSGLTSVSIPNSVTSIGDNAFKNVQLIINYSSATGCPWGAQSVRYGDGDFIYADAAKTQLVAYTGNGGNVSIPNSVTSIGESVFKNCTGLTSVTIPNSVTSIGKYAFSGCSGLTSVTIPSAVTSIGNSAFEGCSSLTSVTIPNKVKTIGDYMFYGCSSLTSVTIGNSVTSIGANAFGQCGKLTSISIPASVTSISYTAFELSGYLTAINVNSSNANYASANGVLFNKSKTTLISFPEGKTGTYTIPNTVTSIDASAFVYCGKLTAVYIPNTVKSIGSSAFTYCTASVYCEVERKPSEWDINWNYYGGTVYFGKTITATSSNPSYGTVTGSGTYYHGTSVTINATPNTGYHFDKWGDGNTTNPRTVTVTETKTYTATFAPNIYTISALSTNGTVEGIGNYYYNTPIELTAKPATGYYFAGWGDGNNDNPRSVTVTGNETYTANFAKYIVVTTASAENGTIDGSGNYEQNAQAVLTAMPAQHYYFVEWEDGSTENPRTITATENNTYSATFAKYLVVSATAEHGTFEGTGEYKLNATATVTAVPDAGYHFVNWSNGEILPSRSITVTGDVELSATFAPNAYTISTNAQHGQVEGGGVYNYGQTATLTATPDEHYYFDHWSDNSEENPHNITVSGPAEYTATFVYGTMFTSNSENGSVEGLGTYKPGTEVTITAVAAENYYFVGWSDGNNENPRTITVPDDDMICTPVFALGKMVSVVSENGNVEGIGGYKPGTEVTLTAVPDEGYHFVRWSDGVTDPSRTVTVEDDMELTAIFEADEVQGGGENQGGTNESGENQGGTNEGGENQGGTNEGGNNQGGTNEGGNNENGTNEGGNNPATAVAENTASAVNIYAYGNTIVVENATDEIFVYNAIGGLIVKEIGNDARVEIIVNGTGVYIVKVGNVAKRVMIN